MINKVKERYRHITMSKLWNLAKVKSNTVLRKSLVKSYPVYLIVEPCNVCNLRCPLCPTGQRLPAEKGTMSMKTFERVIDQLHPYLFHLNLYYLGEPLLCQHLHQMIGYAKQKRLKVSVSSNLNIFDESIAEQLIDSRLDHLQVSMDGASQESYEKYRIGGNFNKVLENVSILIEKQKEKGSIYPRIELQFVIFKHNEEEIPRVKEIAEKMGVKVFFRQGALGGIGQSPPLTKDIVLAEKWLSPNKEHHKEYDYFSQKPYIKGGPCGFLWTVGTINWDGSVFPCCWIYDNEHSFGNIMEQSFKTIWNNELFSNSRRLFGRSKKAFLNSRENNRETICYRCKMFKHILNDK